MARMYFYVKLRTVNEGRMSNTILVGIVRLVLFLHGVVRPSPALAVSEAECEA